MGLFERFKLRRMEKGAGRWGRWCANAMIIGFLAARRKHKGVAPTYAWLARRTLLQRRYWKQISETDFLFEKSSDEVSISDDMNLLQVIHIVIDVEFGHELASWGIPSWQRHMYLCLAHDEADKVVKRGDSQGQSNSAK